MISVPQQADVRMIVCEDVRTETNNKLTIVGYYPAEEIKVGNIGPPFGIPITLLFVVTGGEGQFPGTVAVHLPDGTQEMPPQAMTINKVANRPAAHIVKLINYPLKAVGDHSVRLVLGGTEYRRTFRIIHDPSLVPTAAS